MHRAFPPAEVEPALDALELVARIKVDYRDVIVAGEYVPDGLKLHRVRDLT